MVRDRVNPFLRTIEKACVNADVRGVIEALRMFGYINEIEYSELNTEYSLHTQETMIRKDFAETLELARTPPKDPEEILPREY